MVRGGGGTNRLHHQDYRRNHRCGRWHSVCQLDTGGQHRNRGRTDLVLNAVTGAIDGEVSYVIDREGTTGCVWVGSSGAAKRTLRFTNTGTCTVSAHAVRIGYGIWSSPSYAINVEAGTQSVTWGSFSGDLVVGGARKAPSAASDLDGATVSYALKSGSAVNCDLRNAGTGEVEAKAVDVSTTKTCTIIGTATRDGLHRCCQR